MESTGEAHRILADCARSTALAQFFTRKQQAVLTCRFVRLNESIKEVGFRPDESLEVEGFLDELATTGSRECYVNLVNDRVKVFFKSQIKEIREGKIFMELPKNIFRVQRREFLRFKIPPGHVLRVDVKAPLADETLSLKVVDISAGGLAFTVKRPHSDDFISGMQLSGLRFTLNRRAIYCQGFIRHVREVKIEGEDGIAVGILFHRLREEDRKWIEDYVRDQTRRMMAKLL